MLAKVVMVPAVGILEERPKKPLSNPFSCYEEAIRVLMKMKTLVARKRDSQIIRATNRETNDAHHGNAGQKCGTLW